MSRQQHSPSDENRRTVEAMAGYGVPQEDIASVLGIDAKTLRLHYREELDTAAIRANAKVAQTLFRQATEGGNTAAAIFWLKARAGWRETERKEVSITVEDLRRIVDSAKDDDVIALAGLGDSAIS